MIRDNYPQNLMKKMSDNQCKIIQKCFDNLSNVNKKNQKIAKLYLEKLDKKFLKNIPKISFNYLQNTYWHFPVYINFNYDLFKDYLFKNGVDSVSYGLPLLSNINVFNSYKKKLPNFEKVKFNTIFFPLHSDFSIKEIRKLIDEINNFKNEI